MTTGRTWKFGDNINTDLMLPGPVLMKSEAEQARAVFQANRPGWIDEMRRGDLIIGGRNFGMGSSRPAARSLRNIGIGAVIAETINGLFFRLSVNYGFLAIECPGVSEAFEEGDVAEIRLQSWTVINHRTGAVLDATPIPTKLLEIMQTGGVLPLLVKRGLVADDEASRRKIHGPG
jgi:3-isopropylmalate/(R)-2-methylmalate dehydratase small subunit